MAVLMSKEKREYYIYKTESNGVYRFLGFNVSGLAGKKELAGIIDISDEQGLSLLAEICNKLDTTKEGNEKTRVKVITSEDLDYQRIYDKKTKNKDFLQVVGLSAEDERLKVYFDDPKLEDIILTILKKDTIKEKAYAKRRL